MEKITNYLELIQQIQDITPEKEAFCTTGKSLTYSQLYVRLFVQQAKVLHTASFMLWQKKSREC